MITTFTQLMSDPKWLEGVSKIKGLIQTLPRRIQNKYLLYHNSLFGSGKGTLKAIPVVNGPGTDIVSLDKGVIRVTPDTELRGTLFNEFVERNPTIQTAQWYKSNLDTEVSDRHIPASNFSYYGGIENGAFKVQPLKEFNDTTTVIPARNLTKGTAPILEIISQQYLPSKEAKKKASKIKKEIRSLYAELRPPSRVTSKWYHPDPYGSGGDPYIIPNTGERLSDEEMHNISRRLQVHGLIQMLYDSPSARTNTDSASIHWSDPVEREKLLDRQEHYIDDAKRQFDEMSDSLNEWTKPLTPEEEKILSLWLDGSAEPSYELRAYGDKLFKYKFIDVPTNVANLLNWVTAAPSRWRPRVTSLDNHALRFLLVYDQKYLDDVNKAYEAANKLKELRKELGKLEGQIQPIRVVTTNNDTIPISDYNASILDKKMILGNPQGGMFISDFGNLSYELLMNQVNPYLKKHPSVLFMPDMGSYSLYGLLNGIDPDMLKHTYMDVTLKPTYNLYWNLFTEDESRAPYDPKVHYLVGVKRNGGTINYLNYYK